MWAENSVFYQIYPLGFCGAPKENDGITVNRIAKVGVWAEHIRRLGADAVYLSPIFESDTHGYDTRDFRQVDCRLGTNADFAAVCDTLHQAGDPGGDRRCVPSCGPGVLGLPGRTGEEVGLSV